MKAKCFLAVYVMLFCYTHASCALLCFCTFLRMTPMFCARCLEGWCWAWDWRESFLCFGPSGDTPESRRSSEFYCKCGCVPGCWGAMLVFVSVWWEQVELLKTAFWRFWTLIPISRLEQHWSDSWTACCRSVAKRDHSWKSYVRSMRLAPAQPRNFTQLLNHQTCELQ